VTSTVIVTLPLAGMVPPAIETELPPTGAVTVPPLVVVALPTTVTPLGKESVKGDVIVAAVSFGLVMVMVSVESPPATIVGVLKDSESTGGLLAGGPEQDGTETALESSVTAPFNPIARPNIVALVSSVTLASAITVPIKLVLVPRVAELPTCQKTWHCSAPLMSTTEASLAVMRVLATLKMKTAFGSPPALSVSAPVIAAEDEKQ
jgi:hypothetical protein